MEKQKYLTITEFTLRLKNIFASSSAFQNMFLKGEISNFKRHSTGHLYFSIKDERSVINAMMWAKDASKLAFDPVDGTKVLVHGKINIYEARGTYQIYVDEMIEDGVGNLYIAFEKLKAQLSKEGLFDHKYKKPLPKIPQKIGVITAPTGAAVKDIISTIRRRFPMCETILFPCLVQGQSAAEDIVKNINLAQEYDLDVLIVGRGGGSIEDLWPFNEEIVARAIFNCKIPVISAVGHEIDFTIADFVADMRAPTPTGAAEMAVPSVPDLVKLINQLNIRLNESIYKKINYQKLYLDSIKNSFVIKNPMIMFDSKKQTLDLLEEKLKNILLHKLDKSKRDLEHLKNSYILTNPSNIYKENSIKLNNIIEKLELINPLKVLKRGYSLTYKENKIINKIDNIKINDKLNVKLSDGSINVSVEKIIEENR